MSLLQELNDRYMEVHRLKEEAFWRNKMGLAAARDGEFAEREIAMKNYISDPAPITSIRAELERTDLGSDERIGLEGWLRYFEANAIDDPEARALQNAIIEAEGRLEQARRNMKLGFVHPQTAVFTEASSVELSLKISSAAADDERKAAWLGLKSIEPHVLNSGFIEVVNMRNKLGRMLGYEDYYDYKVSVNEGFSKKALFDILDELEEKTRPAAERLVDAVAAKFGDEAREAWNFDHYTRGDLTHSLDPYMPFSESFSIWGRSFAALGVEFRGAELTLDLVQRKGKHDNGFMHGPRPAYVRNGEFLPAKINFTANALPGRVGSGKRAIETFLHEGGHAAHFSNIAMPAPCFSQEFTPFSVALAETQSMFMDAFTGDADWLSRYARTREGERIPLDLIKKIVANDHDMLAFTLRRMLAVVYSEKAIYEMPEDELTAENILAAARAAERRMLCLNDSPRPALSVPHLLSGEASAYYHGYVLARMAVFQTREFFRKRDGYLLDNPRIGPELAKTYWQPGNLTPFPELVKQLTGEEFSARATVDLVNTPKEQVLQRAEADFAREGELPQFEGAVDLKADITVAHGDEVIASTAEGLSFEDMSEAFSRWIRTLEAKN